MSTNFTKSYSCAKKRPVVDIPRAVLVCGVDVDDSTALKIKNPYGALGISKFMSKFDLELRNQDSNDGDSENNGWHLWRVRGDELVYFRVVPLNGEGNLDCVAVKKYVNQFIDVMESKYEVADKKLGLHGYSFLLYNEGRDWDFVWNLMAKNPGKTDSQITIGDWEQDPSKDEVIQDIFAKHENYLPDIEKEYLIDFIGRDVDLGFRISEYSRPNYFVVSPNLAKAILDVSENQGRSILFLGLYELKGCSFKGAGPDKFPLFFLPVRSKGKNMKNKILRNYQIFNLADQAKILQEFTKYEKESCIRMYDKFKSKQSVMGGRESEKSNRSETRQQTLEALKKTMEQQVNQLSDKDMKKYLMLLNLASFLDNDSSHKNTKKWFAQHYRMNLEK